MSDLKATRALSRVCWVMLTLVDITSDFPISGSRYCKKKSRKKIAGCVVYSARILPGLLISLAKNEPNRSPTLCAHSGRCTSLINPVALCHWTMTSSEICRMSWQSLWSRDCIEKKFETTLRGHHHWRERPPPLWVSPSPPSTVDSKGSSLGITHFKHHLHCWRHLSRSAIPMLTNIDMLYHAYMHVWRHSKLPLPWSQVAEIASNDQVV